MSAIEIKAIYDTLLEDKELKKMFLGMTGDWTKDEKSFTRQYNKNEETLEAFLSDDLEDEEDFLC